MECSLIMYQPFPSQTNPNVAIRSVCIPFLTDENIEKLIETIDETKWEESLVRSNVSPTGAYQSSSRVSKLQFIDEKHIQLVQGLAGVISRCNDNNWRFDISSFNFNIDQISINKYDVGGKFDWHMDITETISTRKLSFTVQLSDPKDYKGGDLEFFDGEETKTNPEVRKKGTLIVFPSYTWHRITPITEGTRYSLVGWVHGNCFR